MFILAQAWREARPLHRAAFAVGALLLSALFLVGLVYPVLAWGRPPGLSQDPLLRARLLLDEGRLDASVREFASGARVNRGDPHGISEWGRALGKSGDVNGELEAQRRALELRPRDLQLQSEVAGALFRAGRHPEAIAAWGRVLRGNPRDFRAWAGVGEAWLELDRYPEAAAAFTKSLEIEPRNAAVQNSLGVVRSLEGRSEDALRHFRTAVEILPIPEFVANLKKAEAEATRGAQGEVR